MVDISIVGRYLHDRLQYRRTNDDYFSTLRQKIGRLAVSIRKDVTLISQDVTLIPNWFRPSGDTTAALRPGRKDHRSAEYPA